MVKFTLSKAPKSLKKFDKYVFEFSLHGRYVLLAIAKWWMQLTVRLRKEGFYCTALRGESDYKISINSDMSVSCNCDDVFGRGYLGSLHEHSFQEIFSGPIAMRFRRELANGRIPILECVKCWELKKISKDKEPLEVANKATAHLYISNPLKNHHDSVGWFSGLFITHPPINERLKALGAMS